MSRHAFGPAILSLAVAMASSDLAAQEPRADATVYGGLFVAPAEIGRDVNRAGGDVLVAGLGNGAAAGVRVGVRSRFASAGGGFYGWLRQVSVRNAAGVRFPNHGEAPALYVFDLRLFPLDGLRRRTRWRPFIAVGAGGGLISVDLDNVEGQELRHAWARSAGGGLQYESQSGDTFVEFAYHQTRLSGRGPIAPFTGRVVLIGLGMRP